MKLLENSRRNRESKKGGLKHRRKGRGRKAEDESKI